MNESDLKALIAGLEHHLSSFEWWLYFWTWMVIAGCAGELVFVILEYYGERKEWNKGRVHGSVALPTKPSSIVLILELLSVALVVVGIAGELYIDRVSGDLQTKLRGANGNLVLLLEQRAGAAKDSAEKAAGAAGRANDSANAAVEVAGKAGSVAQGARTEADSFRKRYSFRKKTVGRCRL